MAEGGSKELSEQDFEQMVIKSKKPILVGFTAPWCVACKSIAPKVTAFVKKHADKIKLIKINIEKNPKIAARYKVMSLPTFLAFSNGKITGQVTGVVSSRKLEKKLNAIL